MLRPTTDIYGVVLTLAVLLFCGLSLTIGWGADVDRLVRINNHANAMVPATCLCMMLLALTNLPARGLAFVQKPVLIIVLFSIATFATVLGSPGIGLFVYNPGPDDGLSNVTVIGLILVAITPAIRLGLLRLSPEWTFHVPLFGLLMSAVSLFVISFDPYHFDQIEPFSDLSHYTAIGLTLLFAAQLFSFDQTQDDLDGETA